jgi:5-formaminoimidazole-4-carboxamide-1-beta-D-ribofuranosyl 5'-monophosphate synthetase
MKEVFIEDRELGLKRRIIRKLYKVEKSTEYPLGLKFCVQYLYSRHEEWLELIRIDNYLHHNKPGTHIHFFNKKEPKWVNLDFKEATQEVERLAEKIIAYLEGENGPNKNC